MHLQIKKILAYDVYANTTETDRYQHVCALLEQSIDPETLLPDSLGCNQRSVLTSPRKRAVSCIKKSSASSVSISIALNEIAFSLHEFCTEEYFIKNGSTAVREAFVQAFIENRLNISHEQIQAELESILELRTQAEPPLCISHTFRMKLLEIYAITGNKLFQDPTTIKIHLDCKKHLYEFGEMIQI